MKFAEQDEKMKKYLTELVEVGKRHGFVLAHEDDHGAFMVKLRQSNEEIYDKWLLAAYSLD